MNSFEHRSIGDGAVAGAMVNAGGESPEEQFFLSFGDVIALSGDFFRPDGPDGLFSLAHVLGERGTRLATQDEILCALKVSAVDEGIEDPRFGPGGLFADMAFSTAANRSAVERAVRDRYLALAAVNDDHFVAPGFSDAATGSGCGSALEAYRNLHEVALDEAARLGRTGGDISRAMAREAAAQHYLTDAFAAGHLRTPVADIRRYWKERYPDFWEHLRHRVASDTARALRELSHAFRVLPAGYVHRRTEAELTARTSRYPELSLGDLVARCFHDWDNAHGLVVEGGGVVFGDGHVDEGATNDLAAAAVRAGIDDVEASYQLGARGAGVDRERLYEAVREATGARGRTFRAETMIPRASPENPGQNWLASDVESLWDTPMLGSSGPTVGQALVAMLEPDAQFIRQLDGLGQGLSGGHGPFAVPLLGRWLTGKCCQAFHEGFVEPLAHDPQPVLLALVHGDEGPSHPAAMAVPASVHQG